MADPFSIASGSLAVIAAATNTATAIYKFIRDCNEARADLTQLTRELSELTLILELIGDENSAATKDCLPNALQTQVQAMLTSCTAAVQQIETTLAKCRGKPGPLRWTILEKDRVMALKCSLEALKSGLSLALETINLSMMREMKRTTETIQDNNAEIKHDTSQILEEIYKLRNQLPPSLPSNPERLRLEQWLDSLTHYAESIAADREPGEVLDAASFIERTEEQSQSGGRATSQPWISTTSEVNLRSGQVPPASVEKDSIDSGNRQPIPSRKQHPKTDRSPKERRSQGSRKSRQIPPSIPYYTIARRPCNSDVINYTYCTASNVLATLHVDRVLRFWSFPTGRLLTSLPVPRHKHSISILHHKYSISRPVLRQKHKHDTDMIFCPAMPSLILIQVYLSRLEVWKWDEGICIDIAPDLQTFSKDHEIPMHFVPQSTLMYAYDSKGYLWIVDLLTPLAYRKISLAKLLRPPHDAFSSYGYHIEKVRFISESEVLIQRKLSSANSSSRSQKSLLQDRLWLVNIIHLPLTSNNQNQQKTSISTRYDDTVIKQASITAQYLLQLGLIDIHYLYPDNNTRKLIVIGAYKSHGGTLETYYLDLDTGAKLYHWYADGRGLTCQYKYLVLDDGESDTLVVVRMADGHKLGTIPESRNCIFLRSSMLSLWRFVDSTMEFAVTNVSLEELEGNGGDMANGRKSMA
ncbi:hypothetical protein F5Y12DRAFT_700528 [Xylaria sp. FL1777]|nr:hypothetical protein F5Y12DRAFT_700528 [Xylaria sp. FL1777]